MKTPLKKITLIMLGVVSVAYAVSCEAQEVPAGALVLTPNDLKWSESPRAPGVQTATLVGDPSKPGPYVIRAKYPPDTVNRPHHHPGNEEITVLSGILYFGHGQKMDSENTMTLPAGSFIAEPAKSWHYLFTKAEPVEVEIRGLGPRANIFAP
jgi:quercetin dioxygenase-like cupin family protein